MNKQTEWPVAGKGNMGQPLYAIPHPAPPTSPLLWMVIILYCVIALLIVAAIFAAGYWLGHLVAKG